MAASYLSQGSPIAGQHQKTRQVWTPEEDRMLSEAVAVETPKHGPISWHKVAAHLPGRNNKDCRKRWHYSIVNTIRKGTWTREEDQKLREAVETHGARWSKIAEAVGTRNGDQCWKRWYDCLDPRIDKSPWTAEEDARLLGQVAKHGRNWSEIVHKHFPNRTSLSAKNRYSILQRKQENAASKANAAMMRRTTAAAAAPTSLATPSPAASSISWSSSASSCSSFSSSGLTQAPSPAQLHMLYPDTAPSTASATPEPELVPDWMEFGDADMSELMMQSAGASLQQQQQQLQQQQVQLGDGWFVDAGLLSEASTTPSPRMGPDMEWNGTGTDVWAPTTTAGFVPSVVTSTDMTQGLGIQMDMETPASSQCGMMAAVTTGAIAGPVYGVAGGMYQGTNASVLYGSMGQDYYSQGRHYNW